MEIQSTSRPNNSKITSSPWLRYVAKKSQSGSVQPDGIRRHPLDSPQPSVNVIAWMEDENIH